MGQWIRIDCDMPGHPKVAEFAELVGIDDVTAFGALVRLFTWVKQYCPDGDVTGASPKLMVNAMGLHQGLCAPPEEGWDARMDALCMENKVEEDASTLHMHVHTSAYARAYATHVRRICSRICNASKVHDATYPAFLVCVATALVQARIIGEDGQVSGWVERQPQKGRKRAGGSSKQALAAHRRWNHTPEKPGQSCSVCESEFANNPEWKAVRDAQDASNVASNIGNLASTLHQSSINNVVHDVTKKLSLQYNTIQDNTGLMCSNEHIVRAPSEIDGNDGEPVDNSVDNFSGGGEVAAVEPAGTINPDEQLPDLVPNESRADGTAQLTLEPGDGRDGHSRKSDDGQVAVREEPEGFPEFWRQYPKRNGRKDGKRDARRNWVKLTKTEQTQAVEALREYKRSAGNYPVNASRYLGKDAAGVAFFEDYLDRQTEFGGEDSKYGTLEEWSTWPPR